MSRRTAGLPAVVLALALAGCNSARNAATEERADGTACTRCHGGADNTSGAPPLDAHGESDTTRISVGAHTAHVSGSHGIAAPLGCEACHAVPDPAHPLAHVDGKPRVVLGVAAKANGTVASWNPADATCSAYCHGVSLAGGAATRPTWTRVDGSQAACGACHGDPPPAPHPQSTDCGICHPATILAGTLRTIDVAGGRHLNGTVDFSTGCADCHGDPTRPRNPAAPPRGTHGETDASAVAVGAHRAHLEAGPLAGPFACTECHAVPTGLEHLDGTAQISFGALARRGAQPSWDRTSATCASTYCHGATLRNGGGERTTPVWTGGATQAACGTCHGAPPPPPHPRGTGCAICHPGTVNGDGTVNVAGGMHVDGTVQVNQFHPVNWMEPTAHGYAANRDLASCRTCHGEDLAGGGTGISCAACHGAGWQSNCTFCHGDANRAVNQPAPPVGTQGELGTAAPAVGAHLAHVQAGTLRGPLPCSECHTVPTDLTHVTGAVELTWGPLAMAGGAAPAYQGGACASTYCHGATLAAGGTNQAPRWTTVDGTQAACGTCHGLPPPPPHAQLSNCGACHPETVDAAGHLRLDGGKHMNGALERSETHPAGWNDPAQHGYAANAGLASCRTCHGADLEGGTSGVSCSACHGSGWQSNCTFCHGDPSRSVNPAAPPVGTRGQALTTDRAVGAHEAHVLGGPLARPLGCAECHVQPADLSHVDGTPAVTWGTLARAGAAAPVWNGATCAGTYCHGATLGAGGANVAPVWTVVDGTQAACGACHGAPPPPPHVANADCGRCHDGYTATSVNVATHVNGALDVNAMACTSCHGDASRAIGAAAPPVGTRGETTTTDRAVGAHQAHVQGSAIARPFDCDECHLNPTGLGHIDGTPALVWSSLASGGGSPQWDGATCASTYCHGATLAGGGTNVRPAWTVVDGTQAACGTCHGAPPPYPHPARADCGTCHPGATDGAPARDVHVDGKVDVTAAGCALCHGDASRPVGAAAPPAGTRGETATTDRAVGAHQAHVQGSAIARPFDCDECHLKPTGLAHIDGNPAIVWGALASASGNVSPTWSGATCASTYCHGGTLRAGGTNVEPTWTQVDGTQAACGTCHGSPPPPPHPANPDCGACHTGYTSTTVNVATHVDGRLDVGGLTCTSCHGDATRPTNAAAPPIGTGGETDPSTRAVGAHQAHLTGSRWSNGFACTECHVVPTDMLHTDGAAQVSFGVLATGGGVLAPAWDGSGCATVACHGARVGGTVIPSWTGGPSQAECGSCHGLPPTTGPAHGTSTFRRYHGAKACAECHGAGYQTQAGYEAVNKDRHVNGVVEALACTDCHTDW
ncbi:CxxxxCH/CxxCH domain c-type cytochrome [Anaeromyxobacter dehalogenans]|uniref:Multiheme cytochrome n=1 Tax=Anaeromyxobacter dehalogenans (strain 2CP-C) TaxID=290397 RepID=Q2IE35_ANADE|nr:CxxxxCH/CxxCH domain-containing protein [Anaeromyxobacter dehalogenans]ABC82846.1 Multiheme cytochrome [Anaeromyxobacter dehalogenans 2CP-C]